MASGARPALPGGHDLSEIAETADTVAAVLRGDEVAVRLWLEGGGRVNAARKHLDEDGEVTTGVTLLMDAAENGHERVAELLLQRGAEVNLQNSDGWTALMQAAINGHERVVELLHQRGAEVNTQDCNGHTALMHAALKGQPAT